MLPVEDVIQSDINDGCRCNIPHVRIEMEGERVAEVQYLSMISLCRRWVGDCRAGAVVANCRRIHKRAVGEIN